jgi:8-oxo-dGTP pyrophosphatase MutT (NUDIX family)
MSALFTRVADLFASGHALGEIDLHRDSRLPAEMPDLRPAAVLAAITERERPGLLLIHRPSTMRAHPGQIALPGGKIDGGESAIEAALREAWEELGIDRATVRVIGESDRYPTGSGYDITPVVGLVPADIAIDPNPTEVAQWFEAPLDFLFDQANHSENWIEFEGAMHRYYGITWQDHEIWGVTAGIIVNLSRRLRWHG